MAAMGVTPTAISTAIELGHDALLSMDMSQASDYWGIPSPIQKRDRRSGTHKRTQFETERERLSKLAI
jgi:hypothetical protein